MALKEKNRFIFFAGAVFRKIKDNKKHFLFLLGVMISGISLRVYNFGEWVRFNDDQGRDAIIIRDIIEGSKHLPLLGPKAAGTMFKLGPIFYYSQYLAARLFGNSPEKLAYPDLFFSILAIPMLFLFLRKFFSWRESLISTAIFSFSYYAVEYSRFAWNPNSTPFFALLFLYSLLELTKPWRKFNFFWITTAGIALGIGIQLHTLFLLVVPIVFIIFFSFSFKKQPLAWKKGAGVILIALFLNTPQIYSELRNHGENTAQFFSGISSKLDGENSIIESFLIDSVCHVRGSASIVSSFGNSENCHLAGLEEQMNEKKNELGVWGSAVVMLEFTLSLIFFIGGYILLFSFLKRENDMQRKNFLKLILIFGGVAFLMLIPFAVEASSRYFLIIEFIPFVMLGLWIKFISEKLKKNGLKITLVITCFLVISNLYSIKETFASYLGAHPEKVSAPESVTLGEIKFMSDYIITHSDPLPTAYVNDRSGNLFGVMEGLSYYLDPTPLKVKKFLKKDKIDPNATYFSVDLVKVPKEIEKIYSMHLDGYDIVDSKTFGRFTIYKFGPNQ